MKKFGSFVVVLVLLMFGVLSALPPAAAQGPDPCTDEQLRQWWIALIDRVDRFELAIEQPPSLTTIATIQALRREVDAVETPHCALVPAPDLVADMFNLRTDSMVSMMIGDGQGEALLAQADAAFQQVRDEIVIEPPPPGGEVAVGTAITHPADGAHVPRQVNIQGTVSPLDKEAGDLWLFVLAPDNRYYPQVNYACTNPESVMAPGTRWQMTAYLGSEDGRDNGAMFTLVFGTLTPEITQQIYDVFPAWCDTGFLGFTHDELYSGFQFNELSYLEVFREDDNDDVD
ncbi:MAG: hypothetical protein K8S97_01660 [Anaerolineae bacterium]|nr:hypothetical protein [Anaerolineae bacterium]